MSEPSHARAVLWFERALASVAPSWAARRVAHRLEFEGLARAYQAAQQGRRLPQGRAAMTGPNAEAGPALALVRAHARNLVRNNPYASAAVRRFAAALAGTGITARLKPRQIGDAQAQARALGVWRAFCRSCDPAGQMSFEAMQGQIAAALMESGEVLVRLRPQRAASRGVPLRLEILEGDFLDTSKTARAENGNEIVQGVEFAPDGSRAAYWLFGAHPGEAGLGWMGKAGFISERVEARFVCHVAMPGRPGQVRGVSPFAPVVMRLSDLGDYDDAQIMAKKAQASLAVFRQRPAGPAASSLAQDKDAQGRSVAKLSPGTIYDADPGETVSFLSPSQVNDYAPFTEAALRAVASGLGLPYEALTGDLSKVNYSSLRAGMIAFWEWIEQIQWNVLVPQLLNPIWSAAMTAAGLRDETFPTAAAMIEPDWAMPKRRWVDPLKDVLAEKEAIRLGLKSLRAAIAEQGDDPDATLNDIAETARQLDAKGLTLDGDPRRVAGSGAAQAAAVSVALNDGAAAPAAN